MKNKRYLMGIFFLLGVLLAGCETSTTTNKYENTSKEPSQEQTTEGEQPQLDEAILKAVKTELGYDLETELTKEDFEAVTYLAIFEDEVSSLEGISMLTNLEELHINFGEFSDISELTKLANIRAISISNSYVTEIPDFSGCAQLESLYLSNNLIEDIEPLKKISSLKTLSLDNNRVTSIAPFADVYGLDFFTIDNNCILDYYTIQDNEALINAINEGSQASYAQCLLVENKAKEIVGAFSEDLSELQIEENIYMYIIDNMEFDDSIRPACAFGYAGLFEGKGVCGDYAEAFSILANHAGLETYVCMSETHAWNIVKIEGKYYHCDALWDEVEDEWKHFNVTADYIQELSDHDYNERYYPVCE